MEREAYRAAFSALRASDATKQEVERMIQERSRKRRPVLRRGVRMALVAAALVLVLAGSALAVSYYVNSPEQALKVAGRELGVLQELGVLAEGIVMDSSLMEYVAEEPEEVMDAASQAFGHEARRLRPRYNFTVNGEKYGLSGSVDMATGKLTKLSVSAVSDADDPILPGQEFIAEDGTVYAHRDNFHDLIPEELTLEEMCAALCEYWGFTGYRLAGTENQVYGYDAPAPDGARRVQEFFNEPYITVYFEGDDEGMPMYIELTSFPAYSAVIIGTNHAVG